MSVQHHANASWRSRAAVVAASAAVVASLGLAATASAQVATSALSVHPLKKGVLETERTALGTILVDRSGRTVYVFMADRKGVSNCSGQCLQYWPPVIAPATMPDRVPGVTGRLGVLTRADGTRQLTINGWPLYRYVGDTSSGMTAGQGSDGGGALWWVVGPNGRKITTTLPAASASPSTSSPDDGPNHT